MFKVNCDVRKYISNTDTANTVGKFVFDEKIAKSCSLPDFNQKTCEVFFGLLNTVIDDPEDLKTAKLVLNDFCLKTTNTCKDFMCKKDGAENSQFEVSCKDIQTLMDGIMTIPSIQKLGEDRKIKTRKDLCSLINLTGQATLVDAIVQFATSNGIIADKSVVDNFITCLCTEDSKPDSKPDDSKPDDSKPDDSKPDDSKPADKPTSEYNKKNIGILVGVVVAINLLFIIFYSLSSQQSSSHKLTVISVIFIMFMSVSIAVIVANPKYFKK